MNKHIRKWFDKIAPVALTEYYVIKESNGAMRVKTFLDSAFIGTGIYYKIETNCFNPGGLPATNTVWIHHTTGETLQNSRILNLIRVEEQHPDD